MKNRREPAGHSLVSSIPDDGYAPFCIAVYPDDRSQKRGYWDCRFGKKCVHAGAADHILTQRKAGRKCSQRMLGKCDPGNRNRHQIPVQLVHNPAAVKAEIGIDPVFLIIVTDQLSGFLILFQSHKIKSQIIVKYSLSRIRRMICSGEGAQFCGCAFMCFNHCSTSCKCKNPACSKKVTS